MFAKVNRSVASSFISFSLRNTSLDVSLSHATAPIQVDSIDFRSTAIRQFLPTFFAWSSTALTLFEVVLRAEAEDFPVNRDVC